MNRLRELRLKKSIAEDGKRLTQAKLVEELNKRFYKDTDDNKEKFSKMNISNWENNKHRIKPEKAQQLADYFGVSVGYLLGFNEEKTTPFEQAGYIPTPREYASWEEFDYMQLGKTDLDFFDYHDLRKKLDPFRLELILNYSFCSAEDRELLRKVARKIAGKDSVTFKETK